MASPVQPIIQDYLEGVKAVALQGEQAAHTQSNTLCWEILHEMGCLNPQLPANLKTGEQLNFIAVESVHFMLLERY